MEPRSIALHERRIMTGPRTPSLFEQELENAKQYFGSDFPGNDGLTCNKCGAAVNLGWVHIAWHESRA